MKKITAMMTFLSVFFMMNLPVHADIPVDDSEFETSHLPIVLIIGIIVIVAAVVLAIFLRRSRAK